MSRPGTFSYDYSPLRSPCHRCGAMEEEACMPIKPGPNATILSYHPERGVSAGHLVRDQGYIAYVLIGDTDPTAKLFLVRKPRQAPVERDGWLPESSSTDDTVRLTVEKIQDPTDRRRVQYWRWSRNGKHLGAVSYKPEGWRAIIYRRNGDQMVTELGYHDTHDQADAAIRDWAEQNPETTR